MPQVPRRLNQHRNHLIVCGDDALAYRVVEELTVTYGEQVTVLLSSAGRGHGPRIAQLPGVPVIERPELDTQAFTAAQAQSARAMALTRQDDLGNFHAALRAQDLNPDLRLVMRIFNTGLGERMRSFFPDCAVLSSSSMAAPSFVAAALGEPAPSHVRLAGRTLYVARRQIPTRAISSAGWPRPARSSPRSCCRPARTEPTWSSRWPTAPRATR